MAASNAPISPDAASWRLGMGTLLQGLNSSMIAVAVGEITVWSGDAGAVPWMVSAMYVAAAVSGPVCGHLADLVGAKPVYYGGMALAAVAALIGAFGTNIWMLIAARALMGIGTAAHAPVAVAVVARIGALRGVSTATGVGTISMLGQVSAAVGPVVGGLLVTGLGWRWIFWFNLVLVANALLWSIRIPWGELPGALAAGGEGGRPHLWGALRAAVDIGGAALFSLTMVATLLALLEGGAGVRIAGLLVAVGLGIALVRYERHRNEPFIDVVFLREHPIVATVYLRTVLVNVAFYAVFYGLPQQLESEGGMSAAVVGSVLLPNFLAGVVTTQIAARMRWIRDPGRMRTTGMVLLLVGGVTATWLVGTGSGVAAYIAALLLGMHSGFNNMGNQLEINRSVPPARLAQATGMFRTAQFIGAAISTPLVFSALSFTDAEARVLGLGAVIVGAGILVGILDALTRRRTRP